MKIYAQMDTKSDAKIDVWAIRGPTFEVLGTFLRSPIFNEFSIGKKSTEHQRFWGRGAAKCISRRFAGSGRRVGRGPSEVRSLQKSE